jgi:hypothetical protein
MVVTGVHMVTHREWGDAAPRIHNYSYIEGISSRDLLYSIVTIGNDHILYPWKDK